MQSRWHSFLETMTNIVIGFVVALLSQLLIFPAYGIHVSLSTDLAITAWFTLVSIIRSYLLRRWYTRRTEQLVKKELTAPMN